MTAKFLHADNEDSDQTERMRRLILERTCKVRFLTLRLKPTEAEHEKKIKTLMSEVKSEYPVCICGA